MNKILYASLIILIGLIPFTCQNDDQNLIQQLKCEYVENPIGIERLTPRLSWIFTSPNQGSRQKAYQILVASHPSILDNDRGDFRFDLG